MRDDVNGLLRAPILATAAGALRRHGGDRAAAAASLRRTGGTPYRGPGAQLSDVLIPRFYGYAADVVEMRPLPGPMPVPPSHTHPGIGYRCGCAEGERAAGR